MNEVWAVPVDSHGSQTFANFDDAVKAEVQSDRTFELSLPKDRDFIMLLMDTAAAERRNQLISYVSLADTNNTLSLLYLPVSEAEAGEVDLGELEEDAASGEAQSPNLDEAVARFSLSLDQLLELASVDDTFKAIKNQFVNRDPDTGRYYDLNLGFSWFINYGVLAKGVDGLNDSALPASHPVNVSLEPNGWYSGYSLQVSTNRDLSADNVCPPTGTYWATVPNEDGGKLLGIFPPANSEIHHSLLDATYTETDPIGNDGSSYVSGAEEAGIGLGRHYYDTGCMDADMAVISEVHGGKTIWRFGLWGDDYLEGAVPSGEWVVKLKDNNGQETELAWFDVAAGYPFNADGKPIVYLPVPTIETADDHQVTAITIDWVRWNGTEYVPADPVAAQMVASRFSVGVIDDNVGSVGNRVEGYVTSDTMPTSLTLSEITASGIDPNIPWYFDPTGGLDGNPATNAYHIETFGVNYSMGGVDYRFAYRWRDQP